MGYSVKNGKCVPITPIKGAWFTKVNQPGFIPTKPKTNRVVIRTISRGEL